MLNLVKTVEIDISEKDGYLSQYAGSNELELLFISDTVSQASIGNKQRRP